MDLMDIPVPTTGSRTDPDIRPIIIQPMDRDFAMDRRPATDQQYTSQLMWNPGPDQAAASHDQHGLGFIDSDADSTSKLEVDSDGQTGMYKRDVATSPMSGSQKSVNTPSPNASNDSSNPTVIIHSDSGHSDVRDNASSGALNAKAMPVYYQTRDSDGNSQPQSHDDQGGARPKNFASFSMNMHDDSDTDIEDDLRRERRRAYFEAKLQARGAASTLAGAQSEFEPLAREPNVPLYDSPMLQHPVPRAESTRTVPQEPLYVNEGEARRQFERAQRSDSEAAGQRLDATARPQVGSRQQNTATLSHPGVQPREVRPPNNEPVSTYPRQPRRTMTVPEGRDSSARAAEERFNVSQNRENREQYYSPRNNSSQSRRTFPFAHTRPDTPMPLYSHQTSRRMGSSENYDFDYNMSPGEYFTPRVSDPENAVRYQRRAMSPVLEFHATEESVYRPPRYARNLAPPPTLRGTYDPATGVFYEERPDATPNVGMYYRTPEREHHRPASTQYPSTREMHYRSDHSTPNRSSDRSPGRNVTFADDRNAFSSDVNLSMHAMHGSFDSGYMADHSSNPGYFPYRMQTPHAEYYPETPRMPTQHANFMSSPYGMQPQYDNHPSLPQSPWHEPYPSMHEHFASPRDHYAPVHDPTAPAYDPYAPLPQDSPPQCWPCWPRADFHRRRPKEGMKFSGKGCPKNFLLQFEILANYNGWSRAERAFELATSLTDEARDVLADLDPQSCGNYEKLRLAILNRFAPPGHSAKFAVLLWSRVMQSNETVTAFGHDLRRLAREAYSVKIDDAVLIGLFIRGLQSVGMQRQVHLSQPRTLDEALKIASNYAVFEGSASSDVKKPKPYVSNVQADDGTQSKKNSNNKSNSNNSGKQGKSPASSDQKLQALEKRLNQIEQQKSDSSAQPKKKKDYSTYTCHQCGQKGHIRYQCPEKDEQQDKPLN